MRLKKNIAVSESGFVFDPNNGDSYTLNHLAKEIFELLKNNKSDKEIAQEITSKYDVEEAVFEQNYFDFLAMLSHYNLLNDGN